MQQVEENVVLFPLERPAASERLLGELGKGTLGERARRHRELHLGSTERLLEENEALVALVERTGADISSRDSRIAALVAQNADLKARNAALEREVANVEGALQEYAQVAREGEERIAALEHNLAIAFRQIDEGRISAEAFLSGAASLVEGKR